MLALERLSPLERAAFLLHDVFGVGFEEVAETIGRTPAACRQLATRARAHVRAARPRLPVARERGLQLAVAFFAATRRGDMQGLRSLLAADVAAYADGGGKAPATRQPIVGFDAVMQLHASLGRVFAATMSRIVRYGFINGLPGFVTIEQGDTLQTTALQIEEGPPANDSTTGSEEEPNRLGFWLGAAAQSNVDEGLAAAPPESDLATARHLGRRVAETTLQLVRGRAAQGFGTAITTTESTA